MLGEKIQYYRKQKGLSQEEVAKRLSVVRQTVSKWEQNRSVPDADLLMQLADVLDISVSDLLGERQQPPAQPDAEPSSAQPEDRAQLATDALACQLAEINRQLAAKNRRARRIWRVIGIVLLVCLLLNLVGIALFSILRTDNVTANTENIQEEVFLETP